MIIDIYLIIIRSGDVNNIILLYEPTGTGGIIRTSVVKGVANELSYAQLIKGTLRKIGRKI